jgi:hypothetical protein
MDPFRVRCEQVLFPEVKMPVEETAERSGRGEERRGSPRASMDLPVEYRVTDRVHPHGGIVVNGSETGLLIHSVRDMPIGTKLNIVVLFPERFRLADIEVLTEIVRKDPCDRKGWTGFEYGLRFDQIREEDARKLKQLLKSRSRFR